MNSEFTGQDSLTMGSQAKAGTIYLLKWIGANLVPAILLVQGFTPFPGFMLAVGAIFGVMEWSAFRSYSPHPSTAGWIAARTISWPLALITFFFGQIACQIVNTPGWPDSVDQPPTVVQAVIVGLIAGLIGGFVIGLGEWLVAQASLRDAKTLLLLPANTVAYGVLSAVVMPLTTGATNLGDAEKVVVACGFFCLSAALVGAVLAWVSISMQARYATGR